MQTKSGFTENKDVLNFMNERDIRILNLCHISEDGRLKTLSFAATEKERVKEILELGERVDGSSLFSFLEPGKSDIYLSPRFDWAFINPFSEMPTLNVLCNYLDADGNPLHAAPNNVLARAEDKLLSSSAVVLKALAELEFYVISRQESEPLFTAAPDRNYHESAPFAKFEDLRNEILVALSNLGVATRYGHSEVGQVVNRSGEFMEQQEIELSTRNLGKMADSVAIAKWAIRNICAKHGVSVSFAPKIAAKHAGSGMHTHLCALKDGRNIISGSNEEPSTEARKMIGGILRFAPSISAFANPTPASYLRFISRKESPMHICWSARNRLALIRIPLWRNPAKEKREAGYCEETFEYRAPDAFANTHLLLAGLTLAVNYGLTNPQEALKIAEELQVGAGSRSKSLKTLPLSCKESAENLERERHLYEADGVYPKRLVDKTIESLKSYEDADMWQNLAHKPDEVEKVLRQYRHLG